MPDPKTKGVIDVILGRMAKPPAEDDGGDDAATESAMAEFAEAVKAGKSGEALAAFKELKSLVE